MSCQKGCPEIPGKDPSPKDIKPGSGGRGVNCKGLFIYDERDWKAEKSAMGQLCPAELLIASTSIMYKDRESTSERQTQSKRLDE